MDEDMASFVSSMSADTWIFDADISVDMAHVIMLHEQGIIKKEDCAAILGALVTIGNEGISALDLSSEDVHAAIESRLIELVGEDTGGRMHSARSRNDEVATCIRFTLRSELLLLMGELNGLRRVLLDAADAHVETLMPGFTHTQHAQPTTLAHNLLAHAGALERDFRRLVGAFRRTDLCPLGAAAFASTGFGIDRERTRELLGFGGLVENSMDAVSTRDFMIESMSAFSNLMTNLSCMAEELVLWSSSEFGFIELDDRYASTSSIMPQKKNPDVAELIRGKTGTVHGSLMSVLAICKALPYSYNRDLQEATPSLWRSVEIVRASVRAMSGMHSTLRVNGKRMAQASGLGFTAATELADTIVRETGVPFRTAHHIVGVLARKNASPSLKDIDEASIELTGKELGRLGLTGRMVKDALDPEKNVSMRRNTGGPAPVEVHRAVHEAMILLEKDKKELDAAAERIERAASMLASTIESVI